MMQVVIQPTKSKNKKLEAVIDGKKTVPFGQKNASDFTLQKIPKQKRDILIDIRRMRGGMILQLLA